MQLARHHGNGERSACRHLQAHVASVNARPQPCRTSSHTGRRTGIQPPKFCTLFLVPSPCRAAVRPTLAPQKRCSSAGCIAQNHLSPAGACASASMTACEHPSTRVTMRKVMSCITSSGTTTLRIITTWLSGHCHSMCRHWCMLACAHSVMPRMSVSWAHSQGDISHVSDTAYLLPSSAPEAASYQANAQHTGA